MKSETEFTKKHLLVGLAGQQNAGKSTIFNMLTGASQHIANYPGVTVDKKSGAYSHEGVRVEAIDLPGTYSLTSFSLEERVARDFLLIEKPDVIVNVVDASSLKRSLYFTFQIMEMGFPVVIALNMMDVAKRNGTTINVTALEHALGVDIIPTVARKSKGKPELRDTILKTANREKQNSLKITYEDLEADLEKIEEKIAAGNLAQTHPVRWLTIKLLEGDSEAVRLVEENMGSDSEVLQMVSQIKEDFEKDHYMGIADYMVGCRDRLASSIIESCVTETKDGKDSITEMIDKVVLNRFVAPVFLIGTVFVIYQLSIVKGYELTQYWWPFLAKFRALVAGVLPDAGMLHDPYIRSMGLWMVDSANALLNYIPIFLILFSLIAILEDSGYMARIAFILDKLFHSFGLHGQSTLPYILGGVFAGGCAVPGVMATKGIPDEQSRMATILTVPYMNCLAKIPFYTLLVNVFFVPYKSWAMLFLSTVTIFVALLVARLLTATVLKSMETAPFVMELPKYHPPTLFGIGQRAFERTWQYIKKVGTIVVAVSVCVFTLLQFPGISKEQSAQFQARMDQAVAKFHKKIEQNKYAPRFQDEKNLVALINVYNDYRLDRLNVKGADASKALNARYQSKYPDLYPFLRSKEKDAKAINKALRRLVSERKSLRRQIKEEQIVNSFLGMVGRSFEPVTKWAGFDWKINVAILSSFAARESSVATIGVLYQEGADENKSLEERMGEEAGQTGFTPLHALAIMVFFALYPPCLATTIMIKVQTGSYKWMMFSILFPTALGFIIASLIYTGGSTVGLSGIQMMGVFYLAVVLLAVATGLFRSWKRKPAPLPDLRQIEVEEQP
ncbi:MAG: ferrous iron transport protein B [Desulfobacterales bacterium]|nr:ferrous iron transport protein B [Desulfobacterales bacterium]